MATSGGTIAWIIVAGLFGVLAIIAIVFFLVRWYLKRNKKKPDVEKGSMAKENKAFDSISESIPKIQKSRAVKTFQPNDVVKQNNSLEVLDARKLAKGKRAKPILKTRNSGYEPSDSDTSYSTDQSQGSVMLPVPSPYDGPNWMKEAGSTTGLPPDLSKAFEMPRSKPRKSSSKQNSSQSSIASSQKPLAASSPVVNRTVVQSMPKVNSSLESSCTDIDDHAMGANNPAFIPDHPSNRMKCNDNVLMRIQSDSDAPMEAPSEMSSRYSAPPYGRTSPTPDKAWNNGSNLSSSSGKKVSFIEPERPVKTKPPKPKIEDLNPGQLQRLLKSAPYIPYNRSRPKRRSFGKGSRTKAYQPKSSSLPPQHRTTSNNDSNNSNNIGYPNTAHNTSNQSVETDV